MENQPKIPVTKQRSAEQWYTYAPHRLKRTILQEAGIDPEKYSPLIFSRFQELSQEDQIAVTRLFESQPWRKEEGIYKEVQGEQYPPDSMLSRVGLETIPRERPGTPALPPRPREAVKDTLVNYNEQVQEVLEGLKPEVADNKQEALTKIDEILTRLLEDREISLENKKVAIDFLKENEKRIRGLKTKTMYKTYHAAPKQKSLIGPTFDNLNAAHQYAQSMEMRGFTVTILDEKDKQMYKSFGGKVKKDLDTYLDYANKLDDLFVQGTAGVRTREPGSYHPVVHEIKRTIRDVKRDPNLSEDEKRELFTRARSVYSWPYGKEERVADPKDEIKDRIYDELVERGLEGTYEQYDAVVQELPAEVKCEDIKKIVDKLLEGGKLKKEAPVSEAKPLGESLQLAPQASAELAPERVESAVLGAPSSESLVCPLCEQAMFTDYDTGVFACTECGYAIVHVPEEGSLAVQVVG